MSEMKNAASADAASAPERILVVGRTGSGKTAQIWTLPGPKFAYIFDPNSMKTLQGCDLDYIEFYPDFLEMDATLKGFNKDARQDDRPASAREPKVYNKWVEDINKRVEEGFFQSYNWLIFDSLTFLVKAVMDRQLWINKRYGSIEELADYRVVGSKLADVFGSIMGMPNLNIYCTGHISTFQDEKTKKIETELDLPGKARRRLPLIHTNIWLVRTEEGSKGDRRYVIQTVPEARGLQDIRTSISGLKPIEDVTIESFDRPERYGIGKLLKG